MGGYDKKAEGESSDPVQLTKTETYADELERELERTISTHPLPFEVEKRAPKQGMKFAEEVDVQIPVASGMLVGKPAVKGQEEVHQQKENVRPSVPTHEAHRAL